MSEIKIINRGRKAKCKHFTGVSTETCQAGVKYTEVTKDHAAIKYQEGNAPAVYTSTRSLPCIPDRNLGGATCEKCELPTAEELAAEEREMNERVERIGKARAAIVATLGGPWKKGVTGSRGVIACPVCGKPEGLRFTRSGYNGHIHARCDTPDCCSWME
jgi:hypothetical protein